ncbi:hypothetical protein C7271_20760 [filamentous cyanobacterium CCP5]|nr:hypothetical protein C7271_20760 [filamentous cyanobacterium CCP5]
MAQRKRNSSALSKAERRNEALLSLNPDLDLGNGLPVEQYETHINDVREKLAAYNVARATVGVAQNALVEAERKLNIYSSQMLSGIAAVYGRESDEYEMAGGTRTSDRRRPTRTVASPIEEQSARSA